MDEEPKPHRIIIGRSINPAKDELAYTMRHGMTQAEAVFWHRVHRNQLGGLHFRRQTVIQGYIADFYCHRAALVVEVDGSTHDPAYDRYRDEVFAGAGIEVMRFSNGQVLHSPESVTEQVRTRAFERIEEQDAGRHGS